MILFTKKEEITFVNYAAAVLKDDGESATFAIATQCDRAVATDDKRAINFGRAEVPQLQRLTTLQVVKHWADVSSPSEEEVRAALRSIRKHGNFLPPRFNPLKEWWRDVIGKDAS